MHELQYVTHDGVLVDLSGNGIHAGAALDVRGRSYSYDLGYKSISGIGYPAAEGTLDTVCTDPAAADAMRRAFDSDIAAGKPGTLECDGWFRLCYCLKSEPHGVHRGRPLHSHTFALLSQWLHQDRREYMPLDVSGGLGYPHGYPHGYGFAGASHTVDTGHPLPCAPRITVYGAAANPRIVIGGNAYEVHADIPAGAYMVIDGYARKVYTVLEDGTVRDDFAKAERGGGEGSGSYIFEPIKPGENALTWSGSYGIAVGWYVEETELPWCR